MVFLKINYLTNENFHKIKKAFPLTEMLFLFLVDIVEKGATIVLE
jgi:hypothetical protein